jgi:predicted nucleic acid-binding protein
VILVDSNIPNQGLSARDALHIAVMSGHGIAQLLSFDRGFDAYPGVKRLS